VLGSASDSEDSEIGLRATRIGKAVAMHKGVLLSGGCPGYPHAAAKGAASAGGLTIAISPALNHSEHSTVYESPLDSDIIVYTGMGRRGRNVILVRSADAGIFIGGGMGTLNEFTIAFEDMGSCCAIGILSESGGISDRLTDLISVVGKSPRALLVVDSNPEHLVQRIFKHISAS
jgi:uncharacterized protein (TIGR00725 family)